MKLLILGLGAIGQRHLRAARRVKYDLEILALRTGRGTNLLISDKLQAEKVPSLAESLKIRETYKLSEAINFNATHILDARIPSEHLSGMKDILNGKQRILVEKPIASIKSKKIRNKVSELNLKKENIFVGYHLLQHPLIHHLKEEIRGAKVIRYEIEHCEHVEHFQSFRPYMSMHEIDTKKSGGIMYSFSHSIHLGLDLFGQAIDHRRDYISDTLGTCKFGDVAVHEMISIVHKKNENTVYGVIKLAFDSHRPIFRILVHLHEKSILVNIAEGKFEIWKGHKLIKEIKCGTTKPDLLTLQMSGFLEIPVKEMIEKPKDLCTYKEGLHCIETIENILSK